MVIIMCSDRSPCTEDTAECVVMQRRGLCPLASNMVLRWWPGPRFGSAESAVLQSLLELRPPSGRLCPLVSKMVLMPIAVFSLVRPVPMCGTGLRLGVVCPPRSVEFACVLDGSCQPQPIVLLRGLQSSLDTAQSPQLRQFPEPGSVRAARLTLVV